MKHIFSDTEILEYVTLRCDSPENRKFIARLNAAMTQDAELRRRVEAFETVFDALRGDPEQKIALRATQDDRHSERQH